MNPSCTLIRAAVSIRKKRASSRHLQALRESCRPIQIQADPYQHFKMRHIHATSYLDATPVGDHCYSLKAVCVRGPFHPTGLILPPIHDVVGLNDNLRTSSLP